MYKLAELRFCQPVVIYAQPLVAKDGLPFLVVPLKIHRFLSTLPEFFRN